MGRLEKYRRSHHCLATKTDIFIISLFNFNLPVSRDGGAGLCIAQARIHVFVVGAFHFVGIKILMYSYLCLLFSVSGISCVTRMDSGVSAGGK